jgi:hypothetical protein
MIISAEMAYSSDEGKLKFEGFVGDRAKAELKMHG